MKNEIKKSELKEIREAIKEYAESITDRQISFGEYIGVVGTKYVEIINCHEKTTTEKGVNFVGSSIFSEKPSCIPNDVELLPIDNLDIECTMSSPHKVNLNCIIVFNNALIIPAFIEKVIGIIVNKIFSRIKKFIENIKV